ncbi:MAG: glycosyltransferase family 39 protein [Anaerolineae bacterium]|nr:glycosyltransferase family 39 protein [Anaerolineae bacterium]MDK1082030.1 glycosyltransferase family 39 protein [Anaerolineae bacterium]
MKQKSFFASSRFSLGLTLIILFGTALAIRVYDITDLPLDFHPTRQLFSAVKARGMYYETLPDIPEWQREFAIQGWKTKVTIEPEILERLAAFIYQSTGEQLWIPRLISAGIWLLGGIFIFALARDMISVDGAVLALAFYLLVPYGIYASRSFQPDPLMVGLIVAFWWLLYRWAHLTPNPSLTWRGGPWIWAILAGIVGGLAVFVKFVAAFFVIGAAIGVLFGNFKLRELVRNPQVWTMGILGVLPGAVWIVYGKWVLGLFGGDLSGRFFPALLGDLVFYVQWQVKGAVVASGIGIMLGLLGLLIAKERGTRTFLLGIWAAYLVFGLYFNYHISTHDYYSLPLIAITAVSLAPLGGWFFARLVEAGSSRGGDAGWVRSAVFVVLLYGIFSTVWDVRNEMKSVDYRLEEAYWIEIGNSIEPNESAIALTEDYGNRLAYWGWRKLPVWPSSGDLYQAQLRGNPRNIEKLFAKVVAQNSIFLITDLDDFANQTDLQGQLASYPVIVQGDGYLIYDLQDPLEVGP